MMSYVEDVQAVVMMGGMGTRLGSITADCPKPLLPVGDRPFFDYEFLLLLRAGFKKFLFCTGYLSSEIEEHYGDGSKYGVNISYVRDGTDEEGKPLLLGTGGALRHAMDSLEEDFLLVYADSFMDIDYGEVVWRYRRAKEEGALSLMTLLFNDGRYDESNVIYEEGRILLYEKHSSDPRMRYIDYGVNMFSKSVLSDRAKGEVFDLSDIQHELSKAGKLAGLTVRKRFYEIGRPDPYREFTEYAGERFDIPKKAAFLDRDGVLNEIVYNEDTEQLDSPLKVSELQLLPKAAEAVSELKKRGYYIFVVTNQPAAAKGKADPGTLMDINRKLTELIPEIDDVFVCMHHPVGSPRCKEKGLIRKCDCRKPGIGLIEEAAARYCIDMKASFMAGDSYTDIACGKAAGLRTVFLGDLKCDICKRLSYDKPDIIASSLWDALGMLS